MEDPYAGKVGTEAALTAAERTLSVVRQIW
jgi:hypothetical protein